MKKLYAFVLAAAAAVSMNAEPIVGAEVYLRGGFNGWAATDQFTETTPGIYTINIATIQGEFKVADANWSAINFGGNGSKIEFDIPYTLVSNGGNIQLAAGKADNVTFTLNTTGDEPTLTVTGQKAEITEYTVAIAGAFNNWDASANCVTVPASVGVAEIVVPNYQNAVEGIDGDGFKIVVNTQWFSNGLILDAGVPYVVDGNDNENMLLPFGWDGPVTATFIYDCKSATLTVAEGAGVESVAADALVAPVYYNLQGVRVANPQQGLFIEVRGSQVSKVAF